MSTIKKVISNWDGSGVASANLVAHSSSGQHHISVATSSSDATGTLRIRMIPTGMTQPVAIKDDLEAIDIALIGGARSFVVSGFFTALHAEFTEELTTGTATIAIASNGDHLAALPGSEPVPPTTVIANGWHGQGIVGKSAPGHGEMAVHHIAIACDSVPVRGSLTIQARQTGASGRVDIGGPFDLTLTGTANIIVVGFYDEFFLIPGDTIVGANAINARVASAGTDLNLGPVIESQMDSLVSDVNSSLLLKHNDRVVAAKGKASSAQTIANNTIQKVLFDQTYDYGECFDPATSRFQPTLEGLYHVNAIVSFLRAASAAATAGKRTLAMLYKNGVSHDRGDGSTHDSASSNTCGVTSFITANGITDYFELYAYHSTGHADMSIQASETKMEVRRVGSAVEVQIVEMFALSDYGFWFTAGDFGRDMYETSSGATQVDAADDPIGRWLDKSGNEHHLIQATAGSRALFKQDSSSGLYYALYDGTDDSHATV